MPSPVPRSLTFVATAGFELRVCGLAFLEAELSSEGFFEFPAPDVVPPRAVVPKIVGMVFDPMRHNVDTTERTG